MGIALGIDLRVRAWSRSMNSYGHATERMQAEATTALERILSA